MAREVSFAENQVFVASEHPRLQASLSFMADFLDDCIACSERAETACGRISPAVCAAALQIQYRDMLERLRGISILVRAGHSEAAKILLRSQIEHALSIMFMCRFGTIRYAKAYIVEQRFRDKLLHQIFDPRQTVSQEYRDSLVNEIGANIDGLPDGDLEESERKFEELACDPNYWRIVAEWQKVVTKRSRWSTKWYMLWDGPTTIPELCKRLELSSLHTLTIRNLNLSVHGGNLASLTEGGFSPLGTPRSIVTAASLAAVFFMKPTTMLCAASSEYEAAAWRWTYHSRLRRRYKRITQKMKISIEFT